MKKFLLTALIVLSFSAAHAATRATNAESAGGDTAMVAGRRHAFTVITPKGWVYDVATGYRNGLESFFYPYGTPDVTANYMYAQGFDKDAAGKPTLDEFIRYDVDSMKKKFPRLKFDRMKQETAPPIIQGWLYDFTGVEGKFRESVVYLETPENVITLVFAVRTKADYDRYKNDFVSFANSFTFLTSDPDSLIRLAEEREKQEAQGR